MQRRARAGGADDTQGGRVPRRGGPEGGAAQPEPAAAAPRPEPVPARTSGLAFRLADRWMVFAHDRRNLWNQMIMQSSHVPALAEHGTRAAEDQTVGVQALWGLALVRGLGARLVRTWLRVRKPCTT